MDNYFGLNFDQIYEDAPLKGDNTRYIDNTVYVKNVLDAASGADFNDVDDVVVKIKERKKKLKDTTMARYVSALATFFGILNDEDLEKVGITDKLALITGETGTYWIKKKLLTEKYDASRNTGQLTVAQEDRFPTVAQYDEHYQTAYGICEGYLQKAVLNEEEANDFFLNFAVCLKHDLPDMRGGSTYADMMIDHQSKNMNYVLWTKSLQMIIIVYNKYKTFDSYGLITEIITVSHPIYKIFKKAIQIAMRYGVDYLFYDYVKKREYTEDGFNKFVAKAHKDIGITQADLRIINDSVDLDKINPIDDLGGVIQGRKRRGHNLMEGYLYAKRLRQ